MRLFLLLLLLPCCAKKWGRTEDSTCVSHCSCTGVEEPLEEELALPLDEKLVAPVKEQLEELQLQCSGVSSLPSPGASLGARVRELILSEYSRVESLSSRQLASHHLAGLRGLHMANCRLRHLEEGSFLLTAHLQRVNLSHNLLSRLESSQFSSLSALLSLDLSYNRLTVFGSSVLSGALALRSLSLQGNRLTSLSAQFLPRHTQLLHLALGKNPWTCDCRLLHLRTLSTTTMMPPLATLCPGAFKCAPRLLGVSKDPETSSVKCEASGWPRPRVRWEMNGVVLIRNQAREKEELGSLPRTVTSTLPVSLPGLYTCLVGSQHASLSLQTLHAEQLSKPQGASLGTVVGVAAASAAMVLLLVFLLLIFLTRRAGKKDFKSTVTGSLQYLRSRERASPPSSPSQETLETIISPRDHRTTLARGLTFPPSPDKLQGPPSRNSLSFTGSGLLPPNPYLTIPRRLPYILSQGPSSSNSLGRSAKSLGSNVSLAPINISGLPASPSSLRSQGCCVPPAMTPALTTIQEAHQ